MFWRITLLVTAALSVAAGPVRPQGSDLTLRTLDFPGAPATSLSGINNSGQIVGTYRSGDGTSHGLLKSQEQFSTIDAPNASIGNFAGTFLSGISNSGALVGTYTSNVDGHDHGFLLSGGQFSDFLFPSTPPGHQQHTLATGVNSSGQVVGYYQSSLSSQCGSLPLHGWILTGGSFAQIDFPGQCQTQVFGINDAGQIVGFSGGHGFLLANGGFSTIDVPGAEFTRALGINNSGVIVGHWSDANGQQHGFVLKNGAFTILDFPGATSTSANGIDDGGDIVGTYTDATGQTHGFITDPISLVDPVPDLLNGAAVTTNGNLLATKGRTVQGVAADGVAQVVIRIRANNLGDQFTITLVNDQNTQINPDEDGALGNPGDATFSRSQIAVNAVNTGSGPNGPNPPFAFAVYRAPVDFARQVSSNLYKTGTCGGVPASDDHLACRSVTLQVQTPSGNTISVPVTILRPPVILVHGLWGSPSDWDNFSPLYSDVSGPSPDSRFFVGLIDYGGPPADVTIVSSNPDYSTLPAGQGTGVLVNARANSLGFQFNARALMSQLAKQIGSFKSGTNPASLAVAAVQGDMVSHSMGGNISRTLALQLDFLSNQTLGQGGVHKVITIDTPHLGSPLATQLLQSQNSCVANLLALARKPAFASVQVLTSLGPATLTVAGAVGDLADSPSQALQNIAASGQHALPTALVAGIASSSNLAGLGTNATATFLRATCGTAGSNPLANKLTPGNWPTVFNNQPNDAIVGLNSQLNGLSADPGAVFDGSVHSTGVEDLGFAGPSVLDSGSIPTQVITLLNTPVTNTLFHPLNP